VDQSLEQCLTTSLTAVIIVSILILVDQSLELNIKSVPLTIRIVSILILVDQSLEQKKDGKLSGLELSFNPYFSGSVTGTLIGVFSTVWSLEFQSLF